MFDNSVQEVKRANWDKGDEQAFNAGKLEGAEIAREHIIKLLEKNELLKEVFETYVNATGNKKPDLVEYLAEIIREG